MSRERVDAICWRIMHQRPYPWYEPTPPSNYEELGNLLLRGADWEDAFYAFNTRFAAHRRATFFDYRPPDWIEPEYQAFLAGLAEFYVIEFNLPMPTWDVNDPKYVLPEPWDPHGWMLPDDEESVRRRIAKAHPLFANRNVIYNVRNLIVV